MKTLLTTIALFGLGLAATPATATEMTIGTADTGSAFPFGPNAYLGGYYFQQIYSAAQFGEPFSITNLTFFASLYPGQAGTGPYRISLATTTFGDIANFDINTTIAYADPSYVEVFNGALPTVADGRLSIDLTTPFAYDPAAGNLLLTVFNPTLSSNGTAYFDADNNNPATNSRFSAYPYNSNLGLVTQFNGVAVPEPATWAVMVIGIGAAGGAARRRRVTRAAVQA